MALSLEGNTSAFFIIVSQLNMYMNNFELKYESFSSFVEESCGI